MLDACVGQALGLLAQGRARSAHGGSGGFGDAGFLHGGHDVGDAGREDDYVAACEGAVRFGQQGGDLLAHAGRAAAGGIGQGHAGVAARKAEAACVRVGELQAEVRGQLLRPQHGAIVDGVARAVFATQVDGAVAYGHEAGGGELLHGGAGAAGRQQGGGRSQHGQGRTGDPWGSHVGVTPEKNRA